MKHAICVRMSFAQIVRHVILRRENVLKEDARRKKYVATGFAQVFATVIRIIRRVISV